MPFVKLDCGILDSTLWRLDPTTRCVFLTMLAMKDRDGLVYATAPGIADRAHLPLDDVRRSLELLQQPDPDSRSLAEDGRRILRVDGGYQVVNHQLYRDRDYGATERKRQQRERERSQVSRSVTRDRCDNDAVSHPVTHSDTDSEAYSDPEAEPPQPPAARVEPAEERTGEVTPIDAGDVLAMTEVLAAEWIAAGGVADREWRRAVKGELRGRGLDAGAALVRERIVGQRERSAADAARAQAIAVVSDLVARASAAGRTGRNEWAAVMGHLEPTLNAHTFSVWFRPLVALGIVTDEEGDRLLVGAPNEQFVTWVGRNYQDQIAAAVSAAGLELSVVVVLEPPSAIAR